MYIRDEYTSGTITIPRNKCTCVPILRIKHVIIDLLMCSDAIVCINKRVFGYMRMQRTGHRGVSVIELLTHGDGGSRSGNLMYKWYKCCRTQAIYEISIIFWSLYIVVIDVHMVKTKENNKITLKPQNQYRTTDRR